MRRNGGKWEGEQFGGGKEGKRVVEGKSREREGEEGDAEGSQVLVPDKKSQTIHTELMGKVARKQLEEKREVIGRRRNICTRKFESQSK